MLTASGQTSKSRLDVLEGKTILAVEASAVYTERETYAVMLVFTDGTRVTINADSIMFDQFSSTPILKVGVFEISSEDS